MIPISDDSARGGTAVVTGVIIAACTIVFVWQLGLGASGVFIVAGAGFVPASLFEGMVRPLGIYLVSPLATLVTYMFLHATWIHLLGNMLYMWIFARGVERALGSPAFLLFYLLCGATAALVHGALHPLSGSPMIGASGGMSGVLGAYLLLYPRNRINVLMPVFIVMQVMRLPAYIVLLMWFALQLWYSFVQPAMGGGIAFAAHVGGFVAGMLLLPLFVPIATLLGRRLPNPGSPAG